MDATISKLDLRSFYPEDFFEVNECCVDETGVLVKLKSKKQNCECPRCHQISNYYHGTYKRFVQDLPILGKNTSVMITAHEFECQNEECPTKTIAEHYDHFLGSYGRFTERCEDFISTLALETSCEGASRICGQLGIQISGDTIIRMLKKRFLQMEIETVGSCIGIDDFSTKKGNTYCTIVCDSDSHRPVAVLEGRDGASLKEWLKKNKHVKTVTRDRASAYAKVINEELPDAMQIADRFHLHQNLLEIIKKCISSNLPQTIRIESDCDHKEVSDIPEKVTQNLGIANDTSKKMLSNVDNLTENEKKRFELLTSIQNMIAAEYKYEDIASTLGISTRTVCRYKDCNPFEQCRLERPSRKKEIYEYKDEIVSLIREGYHAAGIAQKMKEEGCPLGMSTIRRYAKLFADECSNDISKNKKGPKAESKKALEKAVAKTVVIKKQDIVRLLWMDKTIESLHLNLLYQQYPVVRKLKACIDEFRQIFIHKSMPRLYLFIECYKKSEFAPIASFAKGLERDIEAVENAVASPLSNGFVEGINNRIKMIKRVMYGRCGLELLSAKIMLPHT